MKKFTLLVFVAVFAFSTFALSSNDAEARRRRDREPDPNAIVYVIGGRSSNTYHPYFCNRCQRHKRSVRAVRYWWARDRGLRRHRGCAPRR